MERRDKRPQIIAGLMIGSRGRLGRHESSRVGLVWGALIVFIGFALLLDHMGYISIGNLFRFWPLILVFFGVGHLFTPSNRTWGILLLVLGTVFQLNTLGITHLGFRELWPVAVIAVGLLLMWGALKSPVVTSSDGTRDTVDTINALAIFGGAERRVSGKSFKGGKATSVFGGVELDFRDADIEGETATLEVNCIFGGVEIRVPESWHVHSASIPVLGGYSDKSRLSGVEDPAAPKRKTLIITGIILFGGVEISN